MHVTVVALLASFVFALPETAAAWSRLGTVGEEISAPAEVYILWDEIDDLSDGQFAALTLTVHPLTVRGVDLSNDDGELYYDTRYPHRSFVSLDVYDCAQQRIARLRTIYFVGERPVEGQEVLDWVEEEPIFIEPLSFLPSGNLEIDAVCAPPRWP